MRKLPFCMIVLVLIISACTSSGAETPDTTIIVDVTESSSATPAILQPIVLPSATATVEPFPNDRPVFLAWPLPAYTGLARISQYPNSPWTWNYLGLNDGQQCPPMFGYLLNVDSWAYWRDTSIPEEQDKAQADPHNFEMVECYSTDGNIGANGHEGTDIKAPAGTLVYAAADGKVMDWRPDGLNSMIVLKHCIGGNWDATHQCMGGTQWYTTYMHIVTNKDLLVENLDVPAGTQVGVIYDQTINSHLHFEVGLDKRSYANFKNPWGRDESPWLGCMWIDQALCVTPDPSYKRVAFFTNDGQFTVQQGDLTVLISDTPEIKQIHLWGERIAILDTVGNVFVQEGRYASNKASFLDWTILAGDVVDFKVTDHRIAMLDSTGKLFVKEGDLDHEWILQADSVRAFSVSDSRIGYLTADGNLFVKQGGLDADWVSLASGVLAFQLNDNRVAVVDGQRRLFVNEGDIHSEWNQMTESVKAFQLTNLRVGVIDLDGNLLVKEGNLRAEWIQIAKDIATFQLSNYRMLVQTAGGEFKYQDGNLYQPLNGISLDAQIVLLNDEESVFLP